MLLLFKEQQHSRKFNKRRSLSAPQPVEELEAEDNLQEIAEEEGGDAEEKRFGKTDEGGEIAGAEEVGDEVSSDEGEESFRHGFVSDSFGEVADDIGSGYVAEEIAASWAGQHCEARGASGKDGQAKGSLGEEGEDGGGGAARSEKDPEKKDEGVLRRERNRSERKGDARFGKKADGKAGEQNKGQVAEKREGFRCF
jgi:hypothetical protein